MSEDLRQLAAEAYEYGYALVYDVTAVAGLVDEGIGPLAPAPVNTFGHAAELAGPDTKFVSVNNDTLYSIAALDLSGGPLRLEVPDTGGRYYVLQFVDAWTNNFAYIGRRASGTAAAAYLLVPPGWRRTHTADAHTADAVAIIECPTMIATIVGRIACDGPDDLPNVSRLQQGLAMTPVNPQNPLAGIPAPAPGVPDELRFPEQMRTMMAAFPPSAADQEYQRRFEPLGLLDDVSPYADLPASRREPIVAGLFQAREDLEQRLGQGGVVDANGWTATLHLFDYNADHLGFGTIDEPSWIIADRGEAYRTRLLAARAGLWGNHGYEAAYPMIQIDADGQRLTGSRRYTLTFSKPPPVHAFWSLTMYDTPDYYLVANPIDRYSIGDRTPGLVYRPDGTLTIVLQRDRPSDPDEVANWLPTPSGDFRPVLRLYQPGDEILGGAYELPPIIRRD